ncbi:actin family [Syncephalastrum racemosum]|uniref:Actin family n=1 Tax=Syncephalastrum racemosum TaxID=13706 RepID=A0A1X2HLJ4_SYNRA|nr:actin family [Syncephalastrum racemosum]
MAMSLREENFIVIEIGASHSKAGMGMSDTNKTPSVVVNMADFDYPIRDGAIASWENLEASWQHILFKELGISKARNEHAVLLAIPVDWTKDDQERITQIFFEHLNVPGIYIVHQPLLSLYGCGSVSGLVIDVGHDTTDVSPVMDSLVQTQACIRIPIAGQHFDQYLLELMLADAALVQQFRDASIELDKEFARFVKEKPGACHVFAGHQKDQPKPDPLEAEVLGAAAAATEEVNLDEENGPNGGAALDDEVKDVPEKLEVEYRGQKFTVGSYRHKVYDPLFEPSLAHKPFQLGLIDTLRLATSGCEPPEIRPKLWENMVVTGAGSLMRGFHSRIKIEASKLLPSSDNAGDAQPRQISFLRIPDYFTVLKDRQYQYLSTWLGGEIVAKLVFIDAKNYVNKVDYNESGPAVIHLKS